MSDTDPAPVDLSDIPRTAGGTPRGPVSAEGITWKAAGAVLVVLLGIGIQWGATNAKLDTLIEEVRIVRLEQVEQGEWIAGAKVEIRGIEADVDGLLKRDAPR